MSKKIIIVPFIILSILFSCGIVSAFTGTGTGVALDPYQITNCDQLQEMKNDLSSYYKIVNDIDCSNTTSWNGGQGFLPIGNLTNYFTGYLDGNAKTIYYLYINRPTISRFVGLIGVQTNGKTYNLTLYKSSITGRQEVGGIYGHRSTAGTASTHLSVIDSNITGWKYVGGIAGVEGMSSTNFYVNNVNVIGDHYVGGLFGYGYGGFSYGVVDNSYIYSSNTSLTGNIYKNYAGGGIGNAFSTGTNAGIYLLVNNTRVECAGDYYSMHYCGGAIGRVDSGDNVNYVSVYNSEIDNGSCILGGFLTTTGNHYLSYSMCKNSTYTDSCFSNIISTNTIVATRNTLCAGNSNVSFIKENYGIGSVAYTYQDIQSTGNSNTSGLPLILRNTTQLHQQAYYSAEWDFVTTYYMPNEGYTYPEFRWIPLNVWYYNVESNLPVFCTPDWSCTLNGQVFGNCTINNTQLCDEVVDLNSCGETYTGDYSEFGTFYCNYCLGELGGVNTIYHIGEVCYSTISIPEFSADCCNETQLSEDCILGGYNWTADPYGSINETYLCSGYLPQYEIEDAPNIIVDGTFIGLDTFKQLLPIYILIVVLLFLLGILGWSGKIKKMRR